MNNLPPKHLFRILLKTGYHSHSFHVKFKLKAMRGLIFVSPFQKQESGDPSSIIGCFQWWIWERSSKEYQPKACANPIWCTFTSMWNPCTKIAYHFVITLIRKSVGKVGNYSKKMFVKNYVNSAYKLNDVFEIWRLNTGERTEKALFINSISGLTKGNSFHFVLEKWLHFPVLELWENFVRNCEKSLSEIRIAKDKK